MLGSCRGGSLANRSGKSEISCDEYHKDREGKKGGPGDSQVPESLAESHDVQQPTRWTLS